MLDLSQTIQHEMSVYPGDSNVLLFKTASHQKDGYALFDWHTNLHAGTHIDAPFHFLPSGETINQLPLESFLGEAIRLDVRNQKIIEWQASFDTCIQEDSCVVLWTNHDQYYGTQDYYTHQPVLSLKFIDKLIEKKIKLLGMDMASPDTEPYLGHQKFLQAGIVLLENLTRLDQLPSETFFLMALPLNITAEASPVRAVAIF